MKQPLLCAFLLMLLGGLPASAQRYRTAAGIRLGDEQVGFTVQQRIFPKTTLEGLAVAGAREVTGTVLIEQHFPMLGKRFNYYVGGGAHVGTLKDYGAIYGFDGIMGIEYKVNGLPFLLSTDLKPAFHLRHEDWFNFGGAFSIRYVIVKDNKKNSPVDFIKGIFKKKD